MKIERTLLCNALILAVGISAWAQDGSLVLPKQIEAGGAFSIQCPGSGAATLYIVGPGQVIKREIQLGQTTSISSGALYNAGHYLVVVSGGSMRLKGEFDVTAAGNATEIGFLAKPSRLPVGIQNGITGAAYLFDGYHNLVMTQTPVHFVLTPSSGAVQTRTVTARNGAAWVAMDSTPQQGADKFVAEADGISSTRVIRQVPGDPCGLKMSARPAATKVELATEPVRDCNGNAVPDGTIVTFTESYNNAVSTVDVPLKRGIAEVELPSHPGATISVASGVVLGNQIRWEK
jgi:hypothetical protein